VLSVICSRLDDCGYVARPAVPGPGYAGARTPGWSLGKVCRPRLRLATRFLPAPPQRRRWMKSTAVDHDLVSK